MLEKKERKMRRGRGNPNKFRFHLQLKLQTSNWNCFSSSSQFSIGWKHTSPSICSLQLLMQFFKVEFDGSMPYSPRQVVTGNVSFCLADSTAFNSKLLDGHKYWMSCVWKHFIFSILYFYSPETEGCWERGDWEPLEPSWALSRLWNYSIPR